MKRFSLLYIVLFISIFAQSCRQDVDIIEITPPNIPPVIKVVASIRGNVSDDNGNIVSGALVTLDNETVETDENGVFQFINKKMNKNGANISIKKDGYFNGSRRLYPSTGATSLVNVELLTLEIAGEFSSDSKSEIDHQGVFLDFPENAVVNEDGTEYNGMVRVVVAYLDPTNLSTLDQMPGDLSGISADGDLVALKSLGMMAVELMDEVGNKLQVKEGQTVDVKIPIPSDLQASAPSTIPMWHFDEENGIWEEEGFADLVGNNYETSLAHFSFWNCDIPIEYVFMKGSITNRGIPMQGITVLIEDLDNNTSGYGVTDENGMFCGYIPGGEELMLTVFNQCGEPIYTATIGGFDEDVILDPINLNILVDFAFVSGTATYCEGELSEYAYIKVKQGTQIFTFSILDDGAFLGNIFYCSEEPIIVTAFDPIAGVSSGEYVYEAEENIEVGNIDLCTEVIVEHVFFEYGDVKINLDMDNTTVNPDLLPGNENLYSILIFSAIEPGDVRFYGTLISLITGGLQKSSIDVDGGGFKAYGDATAEIIYDNGKEYLKATGTFTEIIENDEEDFDDSYTSLYFDILVEIK